MSIVVSLAAAATAMLLSTLRKRRLAAYPPRARSNDARPRALADAAFSAVPVLVAGALLGPEMGADHGRIRILFTALAVAVCISQYFSTMKALSNPPRDCI